MLAARQEVAPGAFAAAVARALPRDIAAFTGRQAELTRLLGAMDAVAATVEWWAFTRSTGWRGSATWAAQLRLVSGSVGLTGCAVLAPMGIAGLCQPLHQVDVVMPARVGRRAAAFLVAEAGVEIGCLEGVGAQGHLVAAAARDFLLGGGQELGAQARAALVRPDPEQVDGTASAPRPPEQPRAQVTAVFADGDAQQLAVGVAGRRGVEGIDLLVEEFARPLSVSLATNATSLVIGFLFHCGQCVSPGVPADVKGWPSRSSLTLAGGQDDHHTLPAGFHPSPASHVRMLS